MCGERCERCFGPIHPCYANYIARECEDCFADRMARVKTTRPRRVELSSPNEESYEHFPTRKSA